MRDLAAEHLKRNLNAELASNLQSHRSDEPYAQGYREGKEAALRYALRQLGIWFPKTRSARAAFGKDSLTDSRE